VVTICTASLTFNNSTFCPHSVFMRFLWISEQTTIIYLYSINWLVLFYCAVRAEHLLRKVWLIFVFTAVPLLKCLVAGLSLWGPGFEPRLVHVRFAADKVALGQVLLRILRFSPASINPPILHTDLHLYVAISRRTNGRSMGIFEKPWSLGNRGGMEWIEKYLFPPTPHPSRSVNAVT
jgi:hypothetical protein